MTGYDISKSLQSDVVGVFWTASHQQIYRELNRLEEKGHVSHKVFPQDGKPDRKVYSLTKSGKNLLRENVRFNSESPHRDPLCACLMAADSISDMSDFREILKIEIDSCLENIDKLEKREKSLHEEDKVGALILSRRIDGLQFRLNWAEQAISLI